MSNKLQGPVDAERLPGFPGKLSDGHAIHNTVRTYLNSTAGAEGVWTITVGGAPAIGQQYTIQINGYTITTRQLTAATTADATAAIVEAINGEPLVNGRVIATGADPVVTVTGRFEECEFEITSAEADLTLAEVTANAVGAEIPFGRVVISDAFGATSQNMVARLPDAVAVPDAATLLTVIAGVTVYDPSSAKVDGDRYLAGCPMAVMRGGYLFVETEAEIATPQDPVFVRVAVDGALDKIGSFSNAAGTGLVELTQWAKWERKTSLTNLAVLELNMP